VVVILGESEIADGTAVVRDLERGEQESVRLDGVTEFIEKLLADQNGA
jgi:histidyl-tRNA synthetase